MQKKEDDLHIITSGKNSLPRLDIGILRYLATNLRVMLWLRPLIFSTNFLSNFLLMLLNMQIRKFAYQHIE